MMKKLFAILLMSFFAVGIYAKDIQKFVVTTNPPLSCQNCENKIKNNIRFEKGVTNIETSIPEQRVVVTYDADKTNPEAITKGFAKIGYQVSEINPCCNPGSECCNQGGACCQSPSVTPAE